MTDSRWITRPYLERGLSHCEVDSVLGNELIDWILERKLPREFIVIILHNNLSAALRYSKNWYGIHNLVRIEEFLYNWAPSGCWGSYERVNVWKQKMEDHRGRNTT